MEASMASTLWGGSYPGWTGVSGQPFVRPDGPLTDLSKSRITTVNACGLRFKKQYIDKLPAPFDRASTMFGNIFHDAVERWYAPENNYQTESLWGHVDALWREYLPPTVWAATERCLGLDKQLELVADAILLGRPELKSPRTTKAFMESSEFKQFEDARDVMLERCDKVEDMSWPKDENPFQAYRKSKEYAIKLQARWRNQPQPLFVEQPFLLDFEGYTLKGRIDQIRQDINTVTGELLPIELLDMKTGRNALSQQEAFLQAWIYYEACYRDPVLPEPDRVCFWLVRHNRGQYGTLDRERHGRLALGILNNTARKIITGDWAPAYGTRECGLCDYKDECAADIGMWPVGADTMEIEGVNA